MASAVKIEENSNDLVYFGGHTYKLFEDKMSWANAQTYCKEAGGHLATIGSAEEDAFLFSLVQESGLQGQSRYNVYFGLQRVSGTTFAWITGEPVTYLNWNTGEPNGSSSEPYGMYYNPNGRWNDGGGNTLSASSNNCRFLCEWDSIITSYGSSVSSWSSKEMEEAYNNGLIPDNLVGEDLTKRVSRSEFASISVKLYESLTGTPITQTKSVFTDIAGDKNERDIKKAAALDITSGVSPTTFAPNTSINREQLATMLCRTIKKYSYPSWTLATDNEYYLDTSGVKAFADDGDISLYAKPSVYYMTKMGIIKGVDATHFAPRSTTKEQESRGYATATREQAIALSLRIYHISDILK